jgi:predicted ATP-grasp superfamily ATP-dependent carboligase
VGFYSRYCSRRWVYPSIAKPAEFLRELVGFLRHNPHDVIVSLFEEALLLSRHAGELEGLIRVPLPYYERMIAFHDKLLLWRLARRYGIPHPNTELLEGTDFPRKLVYPIAVKARQSSSAFGVAKAGGREELARARSRLRRRLGPAASTRLLAQEWIEGEQLCAFAFAYDGSPKGTLVYRNVCELPVNGGAGIVRESLRHPEIEHHVETLLRESRWHGPIGFDFLVQRGTGRVYLIDANPRFTPAVLLAEKCGFDVSRMAVSSHEPSPVVNVRAGVRTRIDPLVAFWMARAVLPQRRYSQRLRIALDLLIPKRRSASDFFDANDLASLRALPAALLDVVAWRVDPRTRGLDYVQASQFAET